MQTDKIADRIAKLLALASKAGTPEEAATAASPGSRPCLRASPAYLSIANRIRSVARGSVRQPPPGE